MADSSSILRFMPQISLPRSMPFMRLPISCIILGFSLLLLGCSSPSPDDSSAVNPASPQGQPPQQVVQPTPGQTLPITAEAAIADQTIQLEVARTPRQQEIGLMFRTELPADRGMLFAFEPPRPIQFWMRNTLIPLDMVFMLDGEVKAITSNAPPCTTPTCPLYGTASSVNQVIELRAGRAAELGLEVGDRVTIRSVEPNSSPTP